MYVHLAQMLFYGFYQCISNINMNEKKRKKEAEIVLFNHWPSIAANLTQY